MAMNGARFRAVWNNMTPILQKVYGGVPDDNCMTMASIHAGLVRRGMARDLHNTQGCLNTLLKLGVIAEPERGCFTRVEIRGMRPPEVDLSTQEDVDMPDTAIAQAFAVAHEVERTVSEPEPVKETSVPVATPSADPIDRLTKITAALRGLADEIEATALDFTEQLSVIEAKTAKLEQLRTLLKGVL